MAVITRKAYRCERCTHEWVPRDYTEDLPKVCPKCKSAYWNTPRMEGTVSYEEFRDQIAGVLRQHRDGMTWTQIRESLNLTQKVPNNRWVHQMENDIGLLRVQDAHGTIIWQLGTKTTGKEKQS